MTRMERTPPRFVLALDQGTTSSRSILFDHSGYPVAVAQKEFTQYFPQPGWVEHDAREIWSTQLATMGQVLDEVGATAADLTAIGVTNQRETCLLWDRTSHRLAGPPHGGGVRAAARART